MTGFLAGALAAVALSVATWFALTEFSQTSIERAYSPAVKLDGVDQEYSPLTDTNREGIAGRDD